MIEYICNTCGHFGPMIIQDCGDYTCYDCYGMTEDGDGIY